MWALTAGLVMASPEVADAVQAVPAFTLAALAMALTAMLIDAGPGRRRIQLGIASSSGRRRRDAWAHP
jgi:hypothetical protein